MVELEEKDRKEYNEYLKNNQDAVRSDIYMCEEDNESDEDILVDPKDIL